MWTCRTYSAEMFRCSSGIVAVVKEFSKRSNSASPGAVRRVLRAKNTLAPPDSTLTPTPGKWSPQTESRRARYASQSLSRQVIQYLNHTDPEDADEREGDSVKEWGPERMRWLVVDVERLFVSLKDSIPYPKCNAFSGWISQSRCV